MSNNTTAASLPNSRFFELFRYSPAGIFSNPFNQPFLNQASAWISVIAASVIGVYALAETKVMEIPTEYLEQIAVPGLIVSGTALSIFLLTKWMVNSCRNRTETVQPLPPPPQVVPKDKEELSIVQEEGEASQASVGMEGVKTDSSSCFGITREDVKACIRAIQIWKDDCLGRWCGDLQRDPNGAQMPKQYNNLFKLESSLNALLNREEFVLNNQKLMNELGEFLASWREFEPSLLESNRLEYVLRCILDPKSEIKKIAADYKFSVEDLLKWKDVALGQINEVQSSLGRKLTGKELELKISMIRYYLLAVRKEEKAEDVTKLEKK